VRGAVGVVRAVTAGAVRGGAGQEERQACGGTAGDHGGVAAVPGGAAEPPPVRGVGFDGDGGFELAGEPVGEPVRACQLKLRGGREPFRVRPRDHLAGHGVAGVACAVDYDGAAGEVPGPLDFRVQVHPDRRRIAPATASGDQDPVHHGSSGGVQARHGHGPVAVATEHSGLTCSVLWTSRECPHAHSRAHAATVPRMSPAATVAWGSGGVLACALARA
jgi:hypothetical protein